MNPRIRTNKIFGYSILNFAFSIFLGLLVLLTIASLLYQLVKNNSVIFPGNLLMQLFLAVTIILFFLPGQFKFLKKQEEIFKIILLIFAMALSILPLVLSWMGLAYNYSCIGGILPWSDAESYYTGAQNLLYTGKLEGVSLRRPINEILYAVRLILSSDDYQGAMLIHAFLLGITAFFAAFIVYESFGLRAGTVMCALILLFAAPYLPTSLSETLGLTFSLLAFASLWRSLMNRNFKLYCVGILFLGFGSAVRPGPLFILVMFSIFAGLYFQIGFKRRIGAIIVVLICSSLPFFLNYFLSQKLGDGSGTTNANFSHTIYGLVVGGKGWQQVNIDFSQSLNGLSDAEGSKFIYQKAWTHFKDHPFDFFEAVALAVVVESWNFFTMIFKFISINTVAVSGARIKILYNIIHIVASFLYLFVIIVGLIKLIKNHRHSAIISFMIFFWAGFLVSVPFFYRDGGIRSTITATPFISATIVFIFSCYLRRGNENIINISKSWLSNTLIRLTVIVGLFLIACTLIAPICMPLYSNPTNIPGVCKCENGEIPILLRYKKGYPVINMSHWANHDNSVSFAIVPNENENSAIFRKIPASGRLMYVYEYKSNEWIFLYDANNSLIPGNTFQVICAKKIGDKYPVYYITSKKDR